MKWLNDLTDYAVRNDLLLKSDIDPIRSCFAVRGKRAGLLLKSSPAPSRDPIRAACWQALIGSIAPVRMSVGALFFLPDDAREVYRRVAAWSDRAAVCHALNANAQAPLEFNLYHYHHNTKWDD